MMMMIIYVDIFPSNSNMKRPSARSRRGQQHRCAVCGSLKHRLETCPYPGATLVKKLKGQLKSKSSRLEPKHPDARLHVRAGTKWQKEARKAYSKSPKSEKQPRRIDSSFDWSVSSSDEAAMDWLCDHGFLQKPKTCPDCSAKTLGGPWKLDQRQDRRPWWFWRCKAWNCQRRKALFFNSRFEGLKVTPAELAYMIMSYISAVWNQCISIAHFVQLTGLGYSSCRHFLDIMSEREAFAGKALSMSAKVTKCIEADGTSVGRFWVKRSNKTYADQIYQLENREGKTFPAFPVHIRLLGLRQRNGPLVLRFLRPRVSCNISVMFPNPTQTKEDPFFFLFWLHMDFWGLLAQKPSTARILGGDQKFEAPFCCELQKTSCYLRWWCPCMGQSRESLEHSLFSGQSSTQRICFHYS